MVARVIESVYREERSRILATLIRWSRSIDDAEEVLHDAFAAASVKWPGEGIPAKPGAWILETARNRLIDRRRVEVRRRELLAQHHPTALVVDRSEPEVLANDILRLFFTCCHPVMSPEAQIALTLRTVGGLATPEIARAFLVPEATMAQRIVRAKAKILDAGVPYRLPCAEDLTERVERVLKVIYLIFNEGYSQMRQDLSFEAIRLGRLLNEWLPGEAEVEGALALMILTHARRDARMDDAGRLVMLDEQDRGRWHSDEIAEGVGLVERALRRKSLGPYQLQAAIAAVHCEGTDWLQVARLYEELLRFDSGPVVRLNHAVAMGYSCSWEVGLRLVDAIEDLGEYQPWHAARAQMLLRAGKAAEARVAFETAIELSRNSAEREYLIRVQATTNPA